MNLLPSLLLPLSLVGQAPLGSGATAGARTPETPPPASCTGSPYQDFDFWVGLWDVLDPAGKFVGTNRIERVGKCFVQENWTAARGGYTGRSLNSVGADGRWRQTWVDTSGLLLELTGGLVDGRMVLEGETPSQEPKAEGPTRNRITWSPEPGGVVRQFWETSADRGKTWTPAFDGRYHRAPEAVAVLDGFFGGISGAWIGSGSVTRRESHVELRIEAGVGSTVRLSWRNVMQGPKRDVFEGFAVYEKKSETEYTAIWWDSGGAKHPVVATASPDGLSLTALWGDAGRTSYSLMKTGELEIVDQVKRPDGTWVEFGRTTLKRQ